ncbi:hypothetical protein BC332_34835 [Capsicum chinense]|nr:hypothetical protein BC332_34835 [Capsicum chinense]
MQSSDRPGEFPQWCLKRSASVHTNELPLRHLFQLIDGITTSPQFFSGPIVKALMECKSLGIVNFSPVKTDKVPYLSDVEIKQLSPDQTYLNEIVFAVISGNCSEDLARRDPGLKGEKFKSWFTKPCKMVDLGQSNFTFVRRKLKAVEWS